MGRPDQEGRARAEGVAQIVGDALERLDRLLGIAVFQVELAEQEARFRCRARASEAADERLEVLDGDRAVPARHHLAQPRQLGGRAAGDRGPAVPVVDPRGQGEHDRDHRHRERAAVLLDPGAQLDDARNEHVVGCGLIPVDAPCRRVSWWHTGYAANGRAARTRGGNRVRG